MKPREVIEHLNETINAHDLVAGRALYAGDARLVPRAAFLSISTGSTP